MGLDRYRLNIKKERKTGFSSMLLFLREACEAALEQKYFLDQSEPEGFVDQAEIAHREQLNSLRSVFENYAVADAPSEVKHFDITLAI